jgi:hypothetical protein
MHSAMKKALNCFVAGAPRNGNLSRFRYSLNVIASHRVARTRAR